MNGTFSILRKLSLVLLAVILVTILSACTKEYVIDFETNNGLTMTNIEVEDGNLLDEPDVPVKTGYTFIGWYSNEDFSEAYDFSDKVSEDLTLYADWDANDYIITMETNGGNVITDITYEYNSDPTLQDPTKEGYSFVDWYFDEALTELYLDYSDIPDNDITLYAEWNIGQYTLTLETNGGSVIAPITQDYLSEITYVEPTAPGYIFYGWYLDSDLLIPYDELNFKSLPSTMPSSDSTLYAGWIIDENASSYMLPTDVDITVTFWHVYGSSNSALLDTYIAEFEALYPNVTINASSQGGYDALRNKVILSISAGANPTMIVGYPEHIASYLNGNAVLPLNDYVLNPIIGLDVDDIIPAYILENTQYAGGLMYSVPYSKSTEVLIVNASFFEANGLTIKTDAPYTWAELDALAAILVGDGPNQCEYLINYDSPANFFITSLEQWGTGYTSSSGEILFDNSTTIAMLEYIQTRFENNTFAIPMAWDQYYGSTNFIAGDICMTVSSTAGIKYNIPANDAFEVVILPIPQYDLTNMAVMQQGPNLSIMSNTTDNERLAAWLFIAYITNAENTAEWSMLTGYLPVSYSGFNTAEYQDFLTTPTSDEYYQSLAVQAAVLQLDYFYFEPAFGGNITSSNVRSYADMAIKSLFAGQGPENIISEMLTQLGVN